MSELFSQIFTKVVEIITASDNTSESQQQQAQYRPQSQQQAQSSYQRPEQHSGRSHGHGHKPHQSNEQGHDITHEPQAGSHHHHERHDDNAVNHENEHYKSLRARANQEGDAMAKCFQESRQAYESGNGARAKELSEEGKAHQRNMEDFNKQASDWIFTENNRDSEPGEIDLHGLYVKEAISRTDQAIQDARRRGDTTIYLIVGKGMHSPGGLAKIKPAIEQLMIKESLVAELDPNNAGVLIVRLDGTGQGMDTKEITQRLEKNNGCIIM